MLIFNREEVENSFKSADNEILQIESVLSLREFTQKLQNTLQNRDNGLNEADYTVSLFRSGHNRQVAYLTTDINSFDEHLYSHTYDPENERGLDEVAHIRPALYEEFSRFTYGQNHDFVEAPKEQIDLATVYLDCLDACGVFPSLYPDTATSIKELQNISYAGQRLYFPWEALTRANRLPEAEDLKFFYGLSAYERAAITDSYHNPTRLLDCIRAIRATQGFQNISISEGFIQSIVRRQGTAEQVAAALKETLDSLYASVENKVDYQALQEAFQAQFRRAPRILPEIYQAFQQALGTDTLSEEQRTDIVSGFKLSNIQKVATTHNPILYVLANDMNYDAIKKEHLQIFSTYCKVSDYRYLKDGFLSWYDKYKGTIKTSDLCNIIKQVSALHFDLSLNPKQLLSLSSQVRGWCNAACVYQQYGIDFRQSIVAIPNRGLVVEDKVQHIRMYILDADDARVFTVGQDCHCCQNLAISGDQTYGDYYSGSITEDLLNQHFTSVDAAYEYVAENYQENRNLINPGAGGSCVANELTNPLAWVTIWEDANTGNTIAEADTHYVPEKNALVYDNIEFVNDGNVKKIYDIIAVYAEQSTFDTIHVGTGYNQQMKSFGKRIATKEMLHYGKDLTTEYIQKFGRDNVYSDYNSSAVKIKQDGKLMIYASKPLSSFRIERKPEENESFRYLLHPVCSSFTDYTTEQKKDLLVRYEDQNLREEEVCILAKQKPELLKEFETLSLEAQRIMLYPTSEARMNCEMFHYIKHPDSLLIGHALEQRPSNIIYFDTCNIHKEDWMNVLEQDGSLVEYCPKELWDEELLITAIKNNPFSIKYIAKDLEETLRNKLIRMAIYKKPILVAHFPDLPEYMWIQICENKGQFGKYCTKQTYRVQEAMIKSSPYNIDYIHTPDRRILEMVAQVLPSVRTNPRYEAYFNGTVNTNRHRSNLAERVTSTQPRQTTVPQSEPIPPTTPRETAHSVEDGFDFEEIA